MSRGQWLRDWLMQRATQGTAWAAGDLGEEVRVSDICARFGWSEAQAMHALSDARHLDGDGWVLSHYNRVRDSYTFTQHDGAGIAGPLNHKMTEHLAWFQRVGLRQSRKVVADPASPAADLRYARKLIPVLERLERIGPPPDRYWVREAS